MQYHHLLYSRTSARDYRWLSFPIVADEADQGPLDDLFAAYFKYRGTARLARAPVAPVYLVRLASITALVTCGPTGLVDRFQRPTFELQGICVKRADTRHLWFALPVLLNQPDRWLQVWNAHHFEGPRAKTWQPMAAGALELNEIGNDVSDIAALHDSEIEPAAVTYPILLRFDIQGLDDLLRYSASPSIPAGDILFGATPEMDGPFPHPIIKAPI